MVSGPYEEPSGAGNKAESINSICRAMVYLEYHSLYHTGRGVAIDGSSISFSGGVLFKGISVPSDNTQMLTDILVEIVCLYVG